ncbi:hypothetical protein [Yoonia sp. R2-816]|uniref:hypothetical protein n=1 Tax=Yoonia sp. R2-816 TaxID=3342638 RepID=UPI00372920AF
MTTQNTADIIPNATIRLAGNASVSKPNSDETIKIGSVLETNEGALLLWLHSYPAHTQTIEITLEDDFGTEKNEVGVLIDHLQWTPEFAIGEVTINGRTAEVTLFGIPVFSATLLLKPPARNRFQTVRSAIPLTPP